MANRNYDDLLERARQRIPKDISERSRWTMPEPDIMIEGSQTILRNFSDIVEAKSGTWYPVSLATIFDVCFQVGNPKMTRAHRA